MSALSRGSGRPPRKRPQRPTSPRISKPATRPKALVHADGTIAVSRGRFPALYRALERTQVERKKRWERVLKLRHSGQHEKADKAAKKALGIKPRRPMPEAVKAQLRAFNAAHKDEIRERQRRKRADARRVRELARPRRSRKLRRRR